MEFDEIREGHWSDQAELPEVSRTDALIRACYSLLFALIISLLESVLFAVVVFQLLYSLVTEKLPSSGVQSFANRIVAYFYQMLRYLTHNDAIIPFPFSDFPAPLEPGRVPYAPSSTAAEANDGCS
jgi:hypothetical protein